MQGLMPKHDQSSEQKIPWPGSGATWNCNISKGLRQVRVESNQAATAQSIFKIALEEYVHSFPIYAPSLYILLPRWHLGHLKLRMRTTKPEHHLHHLPLSVMKDLSITHFSKTKTVVLITLTPPSPSPPNSHNVYLMLLSCCPHPSTCPYPLNSGSNPSPLDYWSPNSLMSLLLTPYISILLSSNLIMKLLGLKSLKSLPTAFITKA